MGKEMQNNSPIGKRLREARLRLNISQKELGVRAGIDEFSASARVNQYERGKHVPDYLTARRLSEALEIPVTYLYADENDLAEMILAYGMASGRCRAKA
ncbi:helix-turn-helix transcriptional regulator, partial [Thiomicrospira sp.]|uniref:helix-turn-helix domain-containing protein n=1 Tax=Thiomicrospira sp. TaxID=935 RepID=UPI002F9568B5